MKVCKISMLLIFVVLCVFSGCKEDIIGTEVPSNKRVQLVKGSSQTGRWEAFEFAMNYTYLYSQPEERAPGSIEFSGSLERSSGGLDNLSIWMYLLDGNGRILEAKSIYASGYKNREADRSFTVTVAAPPDTAGISFSHTAVVSRGHK